MDVIFAVRSRDLKYGEKYLLTGGFNWKVGVIDGGREVKIGMAP